MRRAIPAGHKPPCNIEIGILVMAMAVNLVGCGGRTAITRDGAPANGGQGGRGASGGQAGSVASGGQAGSVASGGTTIPNDAGNSATGGTTVPAGTGGKTTGDTTTPTGTGGLATAGTTGTATGGAAMDAGASDVDGGPNVPPIEKSCSGEPKLGRQGTTIIAPVTAYRMSPAACCTARYGILFHSKEGWGSDIELEVLQTDSLAAGDYSVADAWHPLRVNASEWRSTSGNPPLAAGTVRTSAALPSKEPFQLGVSVHLLSADATTSSTFFCVPSISIAPDAWASRLQVFLLDDPKFSASEAAKLPLDSLVLAKDPLLDLGRIASVTKSSGEIRTLGSGEDFGQLIRGLMQSQSLFVMPFVVVADGARVYLGTFVSPLSSTIGPGPWVESDHMSADRFRISPAPGGSDARWDARILKVLRESSRLIE